MAHIDEAVVRAAPAGSRRRSTRTFASSGKLVAGLGIVLLFAVLAIVGPLIAPDDPSALGSAVLASPSASHWLGTTQTGQDVLSQLLVGTGPTLLYGFLAALIATPLSVLVGVTAGYVGGFVDEVLSAVTNVFLVVPLLPLLITVSGYLAHGSRSDYLVLTLIVGCTGWAWGARVLRAQAMAIRAGDHIEAARAYGERRWRIIAIEMLPNMSTIVASSFLFTVLFAIVLQASLAFLGLVDVTRWTWGTMLYWAQNNDALAAGAWWWFIPPGLCVAILGAGLALANFGIDEVVNPRLRTGAGGGEWRSMRRVPAVRRGLTPVRRDLGTATEDQRSAVELPAVGARILTVRGLCVQYGQGEGAVPAVVDADLTLHEGEVLGVAGESGSGKSTLAHALIRLLRRPGIITAGQVLYHGGSDGADEEFDLLDASFARLRALHWSEISLVPQSAMRALNPVLTIGAQLFDVFARHQPEMSARARRERGAELMRMVNLDPALLRDYPHQLSGGMRQRVVIAMALALRPKIVIMDEPTSALDVVTQRELLRELAQLRRLLGFAILFISHDLPLLAELADSVAVMYRGRIVEYAPTEELSNGPRHPYSRLLFGSFPAIDGARHLDVDTSRSSARRTEASGCVFAARCPHSAARCDTDVPRLVPGDDGAGLVACWRHREIAPSVVTAAATGDTGAEPPAATSDRQHSIMTAVELSKRYRKPRGHGWTHAVDRVSIELPAAGITAVVGETGSGKSTLVRLLAGLLRPTSGTVTLDGTPLRPGRERDRLRHSASVQLVLQDPFSSLNPVHTVFHHLARPLLVQHVVGRGDLAARVDELLDQVAPRPASAFRDQYPYQLSGGQLQRVAIARALAVGPRLLLADEPVSMLDASVRLGVLNLLGELRARNAMAVFYVTHDIASARYLSDDVAVMYAGRIVERGPTAAVTAAAAHPYTRLLLRTVPGARRDQSPTETSAAGPLAPPAPSPGCPFRSSCQQVMPVCEREPPLIEIDTGHQASCWLHVSTSKSTSRS